MQMSRQILDLRCVSVRADTRSVRSLLRKSRKCRSTPPEPFGEHQKGARGSDIAPTSMPHRHCAAETEYLSDDSVLPKKGSVAAASRISSCNLHRPSVGGPGRQYNQPTPEELCSMFPLRARRLQRISADLYPLCKVLIYMSCDLNSIALGQRTYRPLPLGATAGPARNAQSSLAKPSDRR